MYFNKAKNSRARKREGETNNYIDYIGYIFYKDISKYSSEFLI